MVRENAGSNVMITSASDVINKNGAFFLIKVSGTIRPIHNAINPIPSPISCRFTKKSDDPNVSSA